MYVEHEPRCQETRGGHLPTEQRKCHELPAFARATTYSRCDLRIELVNELWYGRPARELNLGGAFDFSSTFLLSPVTLFVLAY